MTRKSALTPDDLFRACRPAELGFATTAELPDIDGSFGQARAEAALELGMALQRPGFNVFVMGEAGSGRHHTVRRMLGAQAPRQPRPADWCYVHNFADANRPRLLRLAAGRGVALKRDMQGFVAELGSALTAAFESDEYRTRVDALQRETKQREEEALHELGQASAAEGIGLLRTSQGFAFAPIKGDETMSPDDFNALPEEERGRIAALIESYQERLHHLLQQFPRGRREMQARVKQASRDALHLAVGHLIEELRDLHAGSDNVLEYLDQVLADVVETGDELRDQQKTDGDLSAAVASGVVALQRYQVNLLVDNATAQGAPIVYEDHPTHPNLMGRVDHVAQMGALLTHFTLIRAGALHRANGGFLLIDAARLLAQPFAYEGLKRALRSGEIRIESIAQAMGWMASMQLEPESMPLDVRVVVFGERMHYYLLRQYDPDFDDLFKIAADFESDVPRDVASVGLYARLIATLSRQHGLRPVDAAAVARLVEYGARLAGDAGRLSTSSRALTDVLNEADHAAGAACRAVVGVADIEEALAARRRREERMRARLLDMTLADTLIIATAGARVGQINGLAVMGSGESAFGHPLRVTATVRAGDGHVIDIEREAALGGAFHTKGVMILSSYLAARHAQRAPLSLSASLVFEQSYGPIEGDSASLAELLTLLSAIAEAPLRQSLAVTGSIDQHGAVQAIGGVNEKIEGFFDLCVARGLTGEQGVIIPAANRRHLMLRADLVEAVAAGRFSVYAVSTVDEAIELVFGMPAGEPDSRGIVAGASLHGRVAERLEGLTRRARGMPRDRARPPRRPRGDDGRA